MKKQRYVNTHFWDDSYIVYLDPLERYLFLYFLTNPLTNIAGAYEITLKRIATDTGLEGEMILKIIERFSAKDKIHYRDGWLYIPNFLKNQSLNENMWKGVEEIAKGCPDWILANLSERFERLSKAFNNLNLNLNRNHNQNGSGARVPAEGGKQESNGIFVGDLIQSTNEYVEGAKLILQEKRMDSPLSMPEWFTVIGYAESLSGDVSHFQGCIEFIEGWARGRITPKMVADNFGKFLDEVDKTGKLNKTKGCNSCLNHPDKDKLPAKNVAGMIWTPNGVSYCICNPKHKNNKNG